MNEIHKKTAKYLCENYKNILLPEFKTQPMISNNKDENEAELNNKVKYVLSSQSHYKFKEYLKNLAKRYRTIVYDVDEKYTSKCCTYCGTLSDNYNYRTKTCGKCKLEIDRDINGSRSIYLKNIFAISNL